MRLRNRYGYKKSYHGSRYRGARMRRAWVAVLLALLAAAVIVIALAATGSVVFTDSGPVLKWLDSSEPSDTEPPAEPSATPVLIIVDESEPETSATPSPTPAPGPSAYAGRPEQLRAVYIPDPTSDEAIEGALGLARAGLINSVVLELKHDDGSLEFISQQSYAINAGANPELSGIGAVIERFHDAGIYVVGGLCAFEDSLVSNASRELSVTTKNGVRWLDWQYHGWLDPYNADARAYISAIAREAAELGADEILLDRFCFPTRGKPQLLYFEGEAEKSRTDLLAEFAGELRSELAGSGAELSLRYDAAWRSAAPDGSGTDMLQLGQYASMFYIAAEPDGSGTDFSCSLALGYADAGAGAAVRDIVDSVADGDLIIASADGRYPAEW